MASRTLMHVEDDPDMQFLVSILMAQDPRISLVGGCPNAADGVTMATDSQPDLIILDHIIEGDTMGLQAAPLLKAAAPNARILLFTTHDMGAAAAREASIDGYLAKDHLSDLLERVQALLDLEPQSAA